MISYENYNKDTFKKWKEDGRDWTFAINHPLTSNSYVWEIGGYTGGWAIRISDKYNCHIDVFEPIKDNFAALKENTRKHPKIKCYNVGVGDKNGTGVFFKHKNSSSLYFFMDIQKPEKEVVKITGVDDLINGRTVDLVDINAEGMEYIILEALLKSNNISRIKRLQIQFHPWVPNAKERRDEIRKQLSQTHSEVYCYDWVWECWQIK